MSYEIQGSLYDTRESALTALIASFVSADGLNSLETIKQALNDRDETAEELVRVWGGGEHEMGFELADDLIFLGRGEDPATIDEITTHIQTRKADIITATAPADIDDDGTLNLESQQPSL